MAVQEKAVDMFVELLRKDQVLLYVANKRMVSSGLLRRENLKSYS
jgi:hypothetical protein